jgi:hypothetical protein
MNTTELANVERLWARTAGKSFEPREPSHPFVLRMIEAGFVKRVDGRCGFERFKDSHLEWTPAAKAALEVRGQA